MIISCTLTFIVIMAIQTECLTKDDTELLVVKRDNIFKEPVSQRIKRSPEEYDNEDEDDDPYNLEGHFINLKYKGEKVNICQTKYVDMAGAVHRRAKEAIISACTGSSAAKWFIRKIAKHIFRKDLEIN